MKHWLWFDTTGAIRGDLVYVSPSLTQGGWPEDIDLNDPKPRTCDRCQGTRVEFGPCERCHATRAVAGERCVNCRGEGAVPIRDCGACGAKGEAIPSPVVSALETFASRPDFGGFISYSCRCSEVRVRCSCSSDRCGDSFVIGGQLQKKPEFKIRTLSGSFDHDDRIDVAPGEKVTICLAGPLRDGALFQVREDPTYASVLPDGGVVLSFSDGVTNWMEIVGPAQGAVAHLIFEPVLRRDSWRKRVRIRGWLGRPNSP